LEVKAKVETQFCFSS